MNMKAFLEKFNTFILVIIVLVAMALGGLRLMKIQIVDGTDYLNQTKTPYISKQVINATRGEIVDINSKSIVENKVAFCVIIENAFFPPDNTKANEILNKTVKILKEYNYDYIESIPISFEKPYTFKENREDDIEKLKALINLNVYATAENCIDKLIDDYDISDKYTDEEIRIIAGIRYEMLLKNFSISNKFILAQDVSTDVITKIKEMGLELSGVDIAEEPIRSYTQVDIIPHEIGTVGPIYAEEYEELKYKGYALNDTVGKSGIEYAMEDYLRGRNGIREIATLNGTVVSSKITQNVTPGNTIKLTIDSEFQRKVQGVLDDFIKYLNDTPKYKNVNAGSIVVLDAKTGAVLALATAPTYTIDEYINNYDEILQRPNTPLINRATDGLYRPGSTFKTISATAGLNEGIVTSSSTFFCGKTYKFHDITVGCTGYHSNINVIRSIQVSCNIYYYELSQRLGIDKLTEYAQLYGLGQSLGLESGDSAGYIANPDTFERLGLDWTIGQLLQAAIGQSEVAVTPLQLASVACTIANEGVRYKPYLVDSIYNYTMTEQIKKTESVIASQINLNYDGVYDYIKQGMILAAQNTPSGEYSLNGLGFDVAIKTGTPQQDSRVQDSVFIGFAPADDPQIAFAGIIEGGTNSKYMVRKIIDAYFFDNHTSS
jgi:penicillin-binding protein 2